MVSAAQASPGLEKGTGGFGNATLLSWWFLMPAVTWPVDLYRSIYHTTAAPVD
jgi:hypothetical protein